MVLVSFKSSFYRTAILLCLLVSFASQVPCARGTISATTAASPPQAPPAGPGGGTPQAVHRGQSDEELIPSPLSQKQKRDLLKANFEKMKRDAGELADLAKALQQELNKSNENILSLDIVEKADKIEKLARRIKGTARGF
jgi:hypothetical protein